MANEWVFATCEGTWMIRMSRFAGNRRLSWVSQRFLFKSSEPLARVMQLMNVSVAALSENEMPMQWE